MFRELNMTLGLSKMSTDQLADEYYQVEQMKPTDCLNIILLSFQWEGIQTLFTQPGFPTGGVESISGNSVCLVF